MAPSTTTPRMITMTITARMRITPLIPKTVLMLRAWMGGLTDCGGPGTSGDPAPGGSGLGASSIGAAGASDGAGAVWLWSSGVPVWLISALPFVGLVDLAQNPVELAAGDLGVAVLAVAGLVHVQRRAAVGALLVGHSAAHE